MRGCKLERNLMAMISVEESLVINNMLRNDSRDTKLNLEFLSSVSVEINPSWPFHDILHKDGGI